MRAAGPRIGRRHRGRAGDRFRHSGRRTRTRRGLTWPTDLTGPTDFSGPTGPSGALGHRPWSRSAAGGWPWSGCPSGSRAWGRGASGRQTSGSRAWSHRAWGRRTRKCRVRRQWAAGGEAAGDRHRSVLAAHAQLRPRQPTWREVARPGRPFVEDADRPYPAGRQQRHHLRPHPPGPVDTHPRPPSPRERAAAQIEGIEIGCQAITLTERQANGRDRRVLQHPLRGELLQHRSAVRLGQTGGGAVTQHLAQVAGAVEPGHPLMDRTRHQDGPQRMCPQLQGLLVADDPPEGGLHTWPHGGQDCHPEPRSRAPSEPPVDNSPPPRPRAPNSRTSCGQPPAVTLSP